MAHGLPDYYRGVDITYQALSRLMVRPTYGAVKILGMSGLMDANEYNFLGEDDGKGMIYGGMFRVDSGCNQARSVPRLTVDGQEIGDKSFTDLNKYNFSQENCHPLYLLKYDDTKFVYSVGFSPGITFETEFEVGYHEAEGERPMVFAEIIYALIT